MTLKPERIVGERGWSRLWHEDCLLSFDEKESRELWRHQKARKINYLCHGILSTGKCGWKKRYS